MGSGWIGTCGTAFAAGVFLVSLGVVIDRAGNWGYLSWPWSSIQWFVRLPSAAAFALGPAYQLEAIGPAYRSENPGPRSAEF
jgi:hypothetical protein